MRKDSVYHFLRSPSAVFSLLVLLVLLVMVVFSHLITSHRPMDIATLELADGFLPPLTTSEYSQRYYLLGTDDQGRDIFSAILFGLRTSLLVGIIAVIFSMVLGVSLGLIAGVKRGIVGSLIMRVADIQMTFPPILVALLIFGVARGLVAPQNHGTMSFIVLIVSIGLSEWVPFARTVQSLTVSHIQRDYVLAAKIVGVPMWLIVIRHIIPHVRSVVLVLSTISLALAIITEATLSYVGVGMPPTQPSLGTLIRVGQGFLFSGEWWILMMPAVTLLLLSLSVNLLGDWLRQYFDPRLR